MVSFDQLVKTTPTRLDLQSIVALTASFKLVWCTYANGSLVEVGLGHLDYSGQSPLSMIVYATKHRKSALDLYSDTLALWILFDPSK